MKAVTRYKAIFELQELQLHSAFDETTPSKWLVHPPKHLSRKFGKDEARCSKIGPCLWEFFHWSERRQYSTVACVALRPLHSFPGANRSFLWAINFPTNPMRHSVCDNKHLTENIHVSRTPAGLINWKAADDFIASVTSVIIPIIFRRDCRTFFYYWKVTTENSLATRYIFTYSGHGLYCSEQRRDFSFLLPHNTVRKNLNI